MVSVCLYFQVHQPYRVKKFSVFEVGKGIDYFSDASETNIFVMLKNFTKNNNTLLRQIIIDGDFSVLC